MNTYVNLHSHSSLGSQMDGLSKVEKLLERAADIGSSAQALTDHGRMNGILRFWKASKEYKITAILGIEAYLQNGENKYHQLLLAGNQEGLLNLYKLSSLSFTNLVRGKPCITRELLETYNSGIIATSTCMAGELAQYILSDNLEEKLKLSGKQPVQK